MVISNKPPVLLPLIQRRVTLVLVLNVEVGGWLGRGRRLLILGMRRRGRERRR